MVPAPRAASLDRLADTVLLLLDDDRAENRRSVGIQGLTAAREVMAPLVFPFLRRFPQVQIDLVTEGRLVDIVAAGFDLGLIPPSG